jgi:hypothetical protein
MPRANGAQLFAGDRMSREYWLFKFERFYNGKNIITQPIRIVSIGGNTGSTEAPSRDAIDMKTDGEFRGKFIKNMSGISEARQEYKRSSNATPIEHFQSNISIYSYELDAVRRAIPPRGGFLRSEGSEKQTGKNDSCARDGTKDHTR